MDIIIAVKLLYQYSLDKINGSAGISSASLPWQQRICKHAS